jgi:hypothetical protein
MSTQGRMTELKRAYRTLLAPLECWDADTDAAATGGDGKGVRLGKLTDETLVDTARVRSVSEARANVSREWFRQHKQVLLLATVAPATSADTEAAS